MILKRVFGRLLDFLFPKALNVLKLEALTPEELQRKLTPSKDLGKDTIAIFNYADENVRTLIWELKYKRNQKITETLAVILFDVLKTELAERSLFENFQKPLLVPMPISKERKLERGYNQDEMLCDALMKLDTENFFEYRSDVLEKIRNTESQTLIKNKLERIGNVKDSMKATEAVKDRNIILIDDVTTTGATFRDACRALRECGAKKILCVALAH